MKRIWVHIITLQQNKNIQNYYITHILVQYNVIGDNSNF